MKIAVGADHWGYKAKEFLKGKLAEAGIEVIDLGSPNEERSDHPVYAAMVGRAVQKKEADRGILICGSGIGMVIAANKVRGVRAAPIRNREDAEFSRLHNDANVIALSGKQTSMEGMWELVETWLKTEFLGGKYGERVAMYHRIEDDLPL